MAGAVLDTPTSGGRNPSGTTVVSCSRIALRSQSVPGYRERIMTHPYWCFKDDPRFQERY